MEFWLGIEDLAGLPDNNGLVAADGLAAVYELRNHEARNLVSRALSRAKTSSPYVPKYTAASSPNKPAGDHAQAPRAIAPLNAPFASRLGEG